MGALVAFAAMLVWVLVSPPDGPEPSSSASAKPASTPLAAEPAKPTPSAAQQKPEKPAAASDPKLDLDLFAGPAPDFITDAHARTLDKKWLDVSIQKQLYQFGQEHKDDARPQLLLAWDSMNREWYGIAVRMYRIAYRADKRAKQDPSMLRDLLFVASRYDKTEFRETTEIIREAYGEEALPRIDDEIAELRKQGDAARTARLERLRAAVAGR